MSAFNEVLSKKLDHVLTKKKKKLDHVNYLARKGHAFIKLIEHHCLRLQCTVGSYVAYEKEKL